MNIKIPYGKGFKVLGISEDKLKGVLRSKLDMYKTGKSEEELLKAALSAPIGSPSLSELANAAKRILIITSDHTRPVPSKKTIPIILDEIRRGNPSVKIKILIATGCHRATTREEMIEKFGQEIVEREDIVNHVCSDKNNIVYKGILPSGGELWLNSLIDWADLTIAEGFIEPHFFAGFSGGRKSILPGIASDKTVLANHCSKFIANPFAKAGILEGNPIHRDMVFAAQAARLRFIINVVINGKKEIINAFAGDPVQAHERGCAFVRSLAEVDALEADIVITSNGGYPLDRNVYQAVKGMTAAEACVKKGGVIIIASECRDGHGGEHFFRWFEHCSSPHEVAERIYSIPQEKTLPDQWQAQILARVLMKAEVIIVANKCSRKFIESMGMVYAPSLKQAVEIAQSKTGKNSSVVVIPDGVGVIVRNGKEI